MNERELYELQQDLIEENLKGEERQSKDDRIDLNKELKKLHKFYENQIEMKEREIEDLKELKEIVSQEILYGGVELVPADKEEIEVIEETRKVIEKIKAEVSEC